MRSRPAIALALLSLTIGTACFEDVGGSDTGNDNSNTTTGDGDGDGDPTGDGDGDPTGDGDDDPTSGEDCQDSEICVDDAIPGWEGPLALWVGDADDIPPACQGNMPIKVAEAYTDLQTNETAETCACACSDLQGATCGATTLIQSSTMACINLVNSWPINPGQCLNLGNVQASTRYSASAPDLVSGSCTPSVVAGIPSAEFGKHIVACGVDAPQSCGTDGVCMTPPEAPFDAQICIATEGEVQCPSGPYTNRTVYHTGFDDARACGNCSCELAPGTKCSGEVHLLSNGCGLQGLLLGTVPLSGCTASIANVQFASFVPDAMQTGSCDAVGGGVEGKVQELGAWTFCCQ